MRHNDGGIRRTVVAAIVTAPIVTAVISRRTLAGDSERLVDRERERSVVRFEHPEPGIGERSDMFGRQRLDVIGCVGDANGIA